jgi:hypothetical protein
MFYEFEKTSAVPRPPETIKRIDAARVDKAQKVEDHPLPAARRG